MTSSWKMGRQLSSRLAADTDIGQRFTPSGVGLYELAPFWPRDQVTYRR